MSDIAIQVRGLGKKYRLGFLHQDTLRDRIVTMARSVLKPSRRLARAERIPSGHSSHAADSSSRKAIWALRDVSFDVTRGEVVGIIGKNGAGKSTLLKILTQITEPTEGEARIRGRVASLLEVGTGFHPELSGRENIFMNGAILGMTRAEIRAKFDAIVAFAEVEEFIDTPVKRYSSGMYVRLAFAVAAHLDPEILLIDEVLAVGDVAFQRKCLGKLGRVAREGRTVLFVSHNMAAIEHFCSRVVLLSKGRLQAQGAPNETVRSYLEATSEFGSSGESMFRVDREALANASSDGFRFTDVELLSASGEPACSVATGDPLHLRMRYEANRQFASLAFVVHLNNQYGLRVLQLNTTPISGFPITELGRKGHVDLHIRRLPLTAGRYAVDIGLARERTEWILKLEGVVVLDILPRDVYGSGMALDSGRGILVVDHHWEHQTEGAVSEPDAPKGEGHV
ncbi:MAG: ABC transporter ATP-binding protein [Kiritimatiellae bacterium]|nr:ABC transporter ATP-binding protein [Kiritimatiellia bacterium]